MGRRGWGGLRRVVLRRKMGKHNPEIQVWEYFVLTFKLVASVICDPVGKD
jgi:hypothetical protein